MKLFYPDIDFVFDTDIEQVQTIVIENQRLLYEFVLDITNQQMGLDGKAILSDNNKIIQMDKSLEILSQFIPFEINKKPLISKAISLLEKSALNSEKYYSTTKLLSEIEAYLNDLAFDFSGNICFNKISIDTLLKSCGVVFCDDYDSLCEKIIDYFELVKEYLGKKIFITLNLRSFIDDSEYERFLQTLLNHNIDVIMIENSEYTRLPLENRIIIDRDLCVIK